MESLAHKDAEEQGMLFRLPCKVGDFIYKVDEAHQRIITRKISQIDICIMGADKYTLQIRLETAGSAYSCQFGRTVFFDKNEAVHALEKYLSMNRKKAHEQK